MIPNAICPVCGNEIHSAGEGISGEDIGLCSLCCDSTSDGDFQETRVMNTGERMRFMLPSRFRQEEIVGEGSFGVVAKCWDEQLRRFVAIKLPKHVSHNVDQFLYEARAASQLIHPNIVQIHDVGEHDGSVYIVNEFIDGSTLREWLEANPPDYDHACRLSECLARAIAYAHKQGIVHRDVKPANILVERNGNPKIADFGLSCSTDMDSQLSEVAGEPIGTPAFMSPEQAKGDLEKIGPRSDVYSLGVILYQMLTGRLPFEGKSEEIYSAIENATPQGLRSIDRNVPVAIEAICLKAMAKNPDGRYASAMEMADDLANYRSGRTLLAHPGIYKRRAKLVFRRNFLAVLAVTCGLSLLATGIWYWNDYAHRNPMVPVVIDSSPRGAQLTWIPVDLETGQLEWQRRIDSMAGAQVRLRPGFYRVIARHKDEYFEVFRTVPDLLDQAFIRFDVGGFEIPHRSSSNDNGKLRLPQIDILPMDKMRQSMVKFEAGESRFPQSANVIASLKGVAVEVGALLIDPDEVTVGQMLDTFPNWQPSGEGMRDDPATGVSFDQALAWAELNGRNLPTVFELQFAATNGNSTAFPWGDDENQYRQFKPNVCLPYGWDKNQSDPPVASLYGGVSEWTETIFVPFRLGLNNQVTPIGSDSLGGTALSTVPGVNWLIAKSGNASWYARPGGLEPVTANVTDSSIGFRTVRRLSNPVIAKE